MIRITGIINTIPRFNKELFKKELKQQALTDNGCYFKKSKWYDSFGRKIGTGVNEAIHNKKYAYRTLQATDFYAVTLDQAENLAEMGEIVINVNDVHVWGVNEETPDAIIS